MLDPASAANAEIYALSITFDPRSCAVRCSLIWYAACQIKLSIFILGLDHCSSDVLFRSLVEVERYGRLGKVGECARNFPTWTNPLDRRALPQRFRYTPRVV